MKQVQQTRKEPNGDCLRACIASLLEVPCEKVPDFTLAPEIEGSEYPAFWLALQSWLADKGLWMLEMHLPDKMPFMPIPLPALCIFFGETAKGHKHAIVGRIEGGEFFPVWNPWPEAELSSGVAAIGLLIPRDPFTYVNFGRSLSKVSRLSHGYGGDNMTAIGMKMNEINGIADDALGLSGAKMTLSTINGEPRG